MEGLVYRTAKQSDVDPFEYVLSYESVDRMGDVISASGWDLSNFKPDRNPIALFNHNANAIIGRWERVRVEGKRLLGRLVFAAAGTSQLVDDVRRLWDQKLLRAVSVGFRSLEKQPLTKDADPHFGPFRYLKSELVECSLVAVPANPNALQISRSFALPVDIQRQIFGKSASQDPLSGSTASRVSAQPHSARGSPMRISKKIEDAQRRINSLRDQLTALSNKDNPSDDDIALMDELPNSIEDADAELQRNLRIESALAVRTIDHDPNEGQQQQQRNDDQQQKRPFAVPKKTILPEDYVFRAITCGVRAFGQQVSLDQSIRDLYGNDEATGIILRAAVNPAQTTVAAAELVQTANGAFLDRLIADSIYGPLSGIGSRYDLGRNGSLKVPVRANTPRAAGAWVGEGAPKPVKRIGLSSVTLSPHKLAVITTFTEEMALYSTPAIEGLLRKAVADDTRESLDGYLIDNVAGSATRPPGLLNGVTPITAASTGTTIEKIVADINGLIAPMEAAGGGGNVVLLMNPAQARRLGMAQTTTGDFAFGSPAEAASKFGISRIIVSTTVPAGTIIAVDADWFATATGDSPRFAVSNEATLHEEDTAPLPLVTGAQGSGVVASPMRSLFQTDSIAIRLSLYVTWSMVRPGMVQTVAGVGW